MHNSEAVWRVLKTWDVNDPAVRPFLAAPSQRAWPNPPTLAQGWLSYRWQRRSGTVYGNVALGRATGPNSPIAGGEDTDAAVDVPSGAPRVATP